MALFGWRSDSASFTKKLERACIGWDAVIRSASGSKVDVDLRHIQGGYAPVAIANRMKEEAMEYACELPDEADLAALLENNRLWAHGIERSRPGFFQSLLEQQAPQWLWIGCADSRVPANELVGLQPGELFVHRNIANVVAHSDLNCLSVLQYAVDMLKVRHITVVGHSGCGGVRAALEGMRIGLADNWIRHIRDVVEKHSVWLNTLPDDARLDAMCQLNVLEQTRNLCLTTVLQDAWSRGQDVAVHGLIYGLHDGRLQSLALTANAPEEVERTYALAIERLKSTPELGCRDSVCDCTAEHAVAHL